MTDPTLNWGVTFVNGHTCHLAEVSDGFLIASVTGLRFCFHAETLEAARTKATHAIKCAKAHESKTESGE